MKLKVCLLLIVFIGISINSFAQKEEREANYHYKSENYYVAVNLFEKLYQQDTTGENTIFRYADCLVKCQHNPELAVRLFTKLDSSMGNDPNYNFNLGLAYHYSHRFATASKYFEKASSLASKDEVLQKTANMWKSYAESAISLTKKPLDVTFVNMDKYINSEMNETTPFISSDGELLFYTSNQRFDNKFMLYSSNVYFSDSKDGLFLKGKTLAAVNSMDDEFLAGISLYDDKLFVQLQGFDAFQDIISSDRNGKAYRGKNMLNEHVNSKDGEFAAFETSGGDTLYFSSTRNGGQGGSDLYYSLKLPDGNWSIPRNLGAPINTEYDEDFPVISPDGSQIYFCSNNPNSMGGFDIFVSKINALKRDFGTPKNIGYPLNDMFDNKTIAYSDNNRFAYVSAIRPDGFGHADLYRVVFNQEDPSVKLYLLHLKKGSDQAMEKFAAADTSLSIRVLNKNKVTFGEYAYDATNSLATIALPPGFYTIEIKGQAIEEYSFKVTIPDVPTSEKMVHKDILLKLNK
ncbi:MAG: PD40 domain-containing protein [Salinivirgaceae bacterium]|nr:PD40 domain-containing protein [Salinivirgaceae bacterium]